MATPDTRSSIVVTKTFAFKGGQRHWSNRYHVTGPESITLTEWEILADAVVLDEQSALDENVHIIQATWSDASTATGTNPHGDATHTKDFDVWGLVSASGNHRVPGEAASFIRYKTDARTVKNHPIYLFNYYHSVMWADGTNADTLAANQKSALEEYGDDWLAGFSDGTNTRVRCGPRGAVAQDRHVPVYITHRDFPG